MSSAKKRVKPPGIQLRYSRWIRLYTEALEDPKIGRLTDAQFRGWVQFLMLAGRDPAGQLPADISEIAYTLRRPEADVFDLIDIFLARELLDVVGRIGTRPIYSPHNWHKRQFKSDDTSAERSRNTRERQKAATLHLGSCNVANPTMQRRDSDSVSVDTEGVESVGASQEGKLEEVDGGSAGDDCGAGSDDGAPTGRTPHARTSTGTQAQGQAHPQAGVGPRSPTHARGQRSPRNDSGEGSR
jgi:hypothetical protein